MCDLSTCFEGRKSESLPPGKSFPDVSWHAYIPTMKQELDTSVSPSFLPLPPPRSMASWTLCFPSFLFSSQIPKFCHIGSKQSFPLCPGQFVKKAGNRRSLATVQPLVQLANSCGPCFQSKRGSFCILANRCWDML